MTKATLFDSFYASHRKETVNYVVDCADHRPLLPLPQTNQQAHDQTAGHLGEERRGVCVCVCFILRKTVTNTRKIQLQLA